MLALSMAVLTRACRASWLISSNNSSSSSINNTPPPANDHMPSIHTIATQKCNRCMAKVLAKLCKCLPTWCRTLLTAKCPNTHTDTAQISLLFTRRVARACPTITIAFRTNLRLPSSTEQATARSSMQLMTMDHLQSSDSLECLSLQRNPKDRS